MEKHQETFFGCDADYRDARIVKKAPSCMQHDDALIAGINLRNGLYRR